MRRIQRSRNSLLPERISILHLQVLTMVFVFMPITVIFGLPYLVISARMLLEWTSETPHFSEA